MKLFIKAAALALAVILSALPAFAQAGTYPAGPVKLAVPFPPGGSFGGLARQIADHLAKKWGQPVLIDNRPDGNTVLGTDVMAKSAPDDHTLGIVTGSHEINPILIAKLPYDILTDLTGVRSADQESRQHKKGDTQ